MGLTSVFIIMEDKKNKPKMTSLVKPPDVRVAYVYFS